MIKGLLPDCPVVQFSFIDSTLSSTKTMEEVYESSIPHAENQ